MKKLLPLSSFILFLAIVSLACESSAATPTPTPVSAADMALTMIGDKLNAEATQQKFESIVEITEQVVRATATQQAVFVQATQSQQARLDAQATANKADANAQATAEQKRMDIQATQQRIDAEATQQAVNAQATQQRLDFEATQAQAHRDVQSTQAAQGTQMAWSATQAVVPTHNLWTQQAVEQDMLLATNEVELSNLEVKRASDTNVLGWLVPGTLAIFAVLVAANYLMKTAKMRVERDADGNPRVLIFDNQRAILPQLMSGPIVDLETGEVPQVVDAKEQSDIVKRDQAIRALEAMPVNPTSSGADAFNGIFTMTAEKKSLPVVEWVKPEQVQPGVLEQIEGQVTEEA